MSDQESNDQMSPVGDAVREVAEDLGMNPTSGVQSQAPLEADPGGGEAFCVACVCRLLKGITAISEDITHLTSGHLVDESISEAQLNQAEDVLQGAHAALQGILE